jgi:hypothetical protein
MVGMQHFGSSFAFFPAQAVAITTEDALIGLARRAGITECTSLTRAVGYIWVSLWFSFSMPLFLDWQIGAGLRLSTPLPVSPMRHAIKMLNETMNVDLSLFFTTT